MYFGFQRNNMETEIFNCPLAVCGICVAIMISVDALIERGQCLLDGTLIWINGQWILCKGQMYPRLAWSLSCWQWNILYFLFCKTALEMEDILKFWHTFNEVVNSMTPPQTYCHVASISTNPQRSCLEFCISICLNMTANISINSLSQAKIKFFTRSSYKNT